MSNFLNFIIRYKKVAISTLLLAIAMLAENAFIFPAQPWLYVPLYGLAYLVVGGSLLDQAYKSIKKGNVFSEFFLMGIATIGAFAIGKYAEGVAVMLLYTIGEYIQGSAVGKARRSIKALVDQQPDTATVERNGIAQEVYSSNIKVGEIIQVKPGEKVPLDGNLITHEASFNTAALTGESKPLRREAGEEIWAGSINQDVPVRIEVTHLYNDTKLSNILSLVQDAIKRKAPTERFISKFARIYTPAVVGIAVGLTFIPWFFADPYVFGDWFYRALIFLVVSCPCALVISIPLGYFGGIGAASKNGILFKGSDFLDRIRQMKTLFIDKTGTVTQGNFKVQDIVSLNGGDKSMLLNYAASLEQYSTHPIARAITNHTSERVLQDVQEQKEIPGKGLSGKIDGQQVLVGNKALLAQHDIEVQTNGHQNSTTYAHVAIDGHHAGFISIADQLKDDSKEAIEELKSLGVERLVMLSGDHPKIVDFIAKELDISEAHGGLLPDQKYEQVEQALTDSQSVGFVGDGVNDAPVITLADVGMAMGGIGADASIEMADVVIQTDQLSKIPAAVRIANFTHRIVWQNIGFALGIKALVMVLAGLGMANMWEAVFADVGVTILAVANAVRVQAKFTNFSLSEMGMADAGNESAMHTGNCCEMC